MKTFILVILFSFAATLFADRPNVVLVMTDDQGYGDLSCTGNPILKTPALDALYEQSTRFTDFHVSPTCSPTRGALLSGHYTNRAGPWHTIKGRSMLRLSAITMGEVFEDGGYATGLFGKWHLGDSYPYRPEDRGFQDVVRHAAGGVGQTPDFWDNSYFDDTYFRNGVPEKFEGFCTDVFFREATRFIDESIEAGKPFFAYVTPNAPHLPYHCPEEYWEMYKGKGLKPEEEIFFGMIHNIDDNVGALRTHLEKKGVSDNTIFIFMTDNGTATGHDVFNDGMRGKKGSAYEGGHRVPFFIHWPDGKLDVARDIDTLTSHIDVLPTMMDLCGLEIPMDYSFDGRSLSPLLYNNPTPWVERTIVTDSQRVVDPIKWKDSSTMTQRWRLINGKELYDIVADPSQSKDVASMHPDVVSSLRAEYEKWWDSISPTFAKEERLRIGTDVENPVVLNAHDWITEAPVSPWNQGHIRRGAKINGYWAIDVEMAGTYSVELRRYPPELSAAINAELDPGAPVIGLEAYRGPAGRGIGAKSAVLSVGDFNEEKPVSDADEGILFTVELQEGPADLHAVFKTGPDGEDVIGAYYAVVNRL
ncbi:arylsulfatase [Pelagicoccus mobilis]|uniref:Arylsulfatase n=2 Tax=Pelagicoccus mobilis TaxID=415221 RepID=A0A934S520_9BACT|nr:arylsulfatase [Pelagicoccus mobilis]